MRRSASDSSRGFLVESLVCDGERSAPMDGIHAHVNHVSGSRCAETSKGVRRTAEVPRKLSRLHKPETMSLEAWQIVLRRQVGREETFTLTNVGETNPSSRSSTSPIRRAGTPTGSSFAAAARAPMSARVPTSRRIRSAPASTSSSFQKKSKKGIARPKKGIDLIRQ